MRRVLLATLAALTATACLGVWVSGALAGNGATVVREKGLTVSFNGGISPRKLPRDGKAPVGVQMGGKIKSVDHEPPILKKIILDINREGVIQTRGLQLCPLGRLKNASQAGARRRCADALVGKGSVTSRVSLPEQFPFASTGSMLAFNGRYKGHPAVFAQVSSGAPLPLTYVIVFVVKKTHGTFGTKMIGTLPEIASAYGYITAFNLSLRRTYRYHGKRLSYASAGCPAPKGLNSVQFSLAKVGYQFEDGRKVSATLTRECRVRK
jgi:hypothetical protein